jgi:hypothetical protein
MNRKLWLSLLVLSGIGCANAQMTFEQQMKKTTQTLMTCFISKDTAKLRTLFETENNSAYKIEPSVLLKDCRFFLTVVDKYGFPSGDSLKMTMGASGENVVYVTLMEKDDTALNLKKCQLGVLFFPDRFLKDPSKMLNYQLITTPLSRPEMKLKIAPPILKPSANK